ncbi:piggyBac transposable element-derived protein 4-like [Rhagoletis pomonella]|uniref:piggyBac transposable element-derived protein 4-like n=1 Tax=Rhagoletis pomonella TaxID=28610 RepID=UPI00177AFB87|nr:piggyBac transposable element-derived protein 4-like [Rhagoletis pomonella]
MSEESDSDVNFEDSGSEYLLESSEYTESASEADDNINAATEPTEINDEILSVAQWVNVAPDNSQNFNPKYEIPTERDCKILLDFAHDCTEFKVFSTIFPYSLSIRIAECTNPRLTALNRRAQSKRNLTDPNEILVFLGVSLIMHYNKLPSLKDYWSKNPSMGNSVIKNCISRDRFLLLSSKLYFNDCDKPTNASRDYYISDVVQCLKQTFAAARSESSFQSIDECMVKFKGRSSMKQYMPMKPIKRGIKIWMRCDSKTGYTYDLNPPSLGQAPCRWCGGLAASPTSPLLV